jgi:hypothetical protein
MADAATLVIGTNSYVTLEEANSYVSLHYPSISYEYKAWFNETLTDSDKIVMLIQSAASLNRLKYAGRKKITNQKLAFPRSKSTPPGTIQIPIVFNQSGDYTLIDGFSTSDGLELAGYAQIENSIAYFTLGVNRVSEIREIKAKNTLSKRAGSISESYGQSNYNGEFVLKGIYAEDKVNALLSSWWTDSVYSV